MTGYNQYAIRNQYIGNIWDATKRTHAPFWGPKLFTPSFFKEEKLDRFYRQWATRIGLEIIKMRHAIMNKSGDAAQRLKMKEEIEEYVKGAYEKESLANLKDVYVTDHVPKQKKLSTTNHSEDEQFYRYK